MKQFLSCVLALVLMFGLAACGSSASAPEPKTDGSAEPMQSESVTLGNALTIYFAVAENSDVDAASSASVLPGTDTGYTRAVADMISGYVGGETYSVQTEADYPGKYDPLTEVALDEQKANERPAVVGSPEALAQSDTVFVVMPVWWGDIPMPMYTFFENNDFSGKTVVVFITHYGSRFGRCVQTVESLLPDATVVEGLAINQNSVSGAESDVIARLQELGY